MHPDVVLLRIANIFRLDEECNDMAIAVLAPEFMNFMGYEVVEVCASNWG